jgi:REP element-mobilizing transposase RayT
MIAIGGDLDHVHLLARLPPSLAVSTLVGETKGASSHLMNHDVAPNREFKWQGAYGVLSVSPHSLPTVIDYIKTQKERHANRRTFDEWEKCYEE